MADVDLRSIRSTIIDAKTTLWRGVRSEHPPATFVPGLGSSRFAPVEGHAHVYVSRTATAALLESALHHVAGVEPTIYRAELAQWQLAAVRPSRDLRLIDLRDQQLERLGLIREQLVDTTPAHYACTRTFAHSLVGRSVGGRRTVGFLWHSRQADIHARAHRRGLLGDLLTHRQTEVAVLFNPPARANVLSLVEPPRPLLLDGGLLDPLVVELSALLAAPIE